MAFNIEITKERLSELFKSESQEAVGKKLNMTQGNVSKLLTGKQQPTVETIFQIAKEYKVSTDWLLGLTEEKKIAKQDMSYGDILKMFSILVEPIKEKDIFVTLIKRPIENYIKKKYLETKEK